MSYNRKNILFSFLILIISVIALMNGCVESVTDSNTSSSLSISISSPVTGDTIYVGSNAITFTATDGTGGSISQYEVFLNGASNGVYKVSSGTATKLYLIVSDTSLYKKVSFYITVYSSTGKYKTSTTQTGLYVVPALPSAPSKLRIAMVSNNEFDLSWIDTSTTTTRFEIWRKAGSGGTYSLLKSVASSVFYTADIVPSIYTLYFYKVRAGNPNGVSAFSNEVNTLIAPSNLEAKASGTTSVQLTWTDNSNIEDGFRIERTNVSTGEYEWIANAIANATSYTDGTAASATTYKYRISAYSGTATSDYSNVVTITTPTADVPPPSLLTANFNYTTRKVDLSWFSSSANPYTYVERKDGSSASYSQYAIISSSTVRSFTDSIITAGNTYYYRVRELTSGGLYTAYSNEDTAYVPLLPPLKPSNLRLVQGSSATEYKLFWQDNSSDETGFELYMKAGSGGTYTLKDVFAANTIAATETVPSSSITYYFKIRAYKNSLYSDFSSEVSTAGGLGFALKSIATSTSSITLQWNDNFSDEIGFSLERKISWQDDTHYVEVGLLSSSSGSTVTYTDTNSIQAYTSYCYRVRAIFSQSYSDYSNILTVTAQ